MEHTIDKQLHLEKENFRDLIHATSEELAIPIQLVEKDTTSRPYSALFMKVAIPNR